MHRCFSKCEGKSNNKELEKCIDINNSDKNDKKYEDKWNHWKEVKQQAENFFSSFLAIIWGGSNPVEEYFKLAHMMQDYGFLDDTSNPFSVYDAYEKWSKIEDRCRDYCAKYWPTKFESAG